TVLYRVPASLPHFIPMPLGPFGTMGAVIAMDGRQANRRQIFDIGIAGPLAGLAICIPVAIVGVMKLDFAAPPAGGAKLDLPLVLVWTLQWLQPDQTAYAQQGGVWLSQLNPYFMAGWFGLLVTAINMAPVSQLDGGHVIYTLFGPRGKWIARAFVIFAVLYVVFAGAYFWSVMLLLVILMGVDHPPTADDRVPLGTGRIVLGAASLTIPLLCLPPQLIMLVGG
ncbi:MAG: site-2 protease family protein, partial [Planctomycetes bacterium]|nr:site-2 protease family protein [Planctomycetota bacterium]